MKLFASLVVVAASALPWAATAHAPKRIKTNLRSRAEIRKKIAKDKKDKRNLQDEPLLELTLGVPTDPFTIPSNEDEGWSLNVLDAADSLVECTVRVPDDETAGDLDLQMQDDNDFTRSCFGSTLSSEENCILGLLSNNATIQIIVTSYAAEDVEGIVLTCNTVEYDTTLDFNATSDAFTLGDTVDNKYKSFLLDTSALSEYDGINCSLTTGPDTVITPNIFMEEILADATPGQGCDEFGQGSCSIVVSAGSNQLSLTIGTTYAADDVTVRCEAIAGAGTPTILQEGIPSEPFDTLDVDVVRFQMELEPRSIVVCEIAPATEGGVIDASLMELHLRVDGAPNVEKQSINDCNSDYLQTDPPLCFAYGSMKESSTVFATLNDFLGSENLTTITCHAQVQNPTIVVTDGVSSEPLNLTSPLHPVVDDGKNYYADEEVMSDHIFSAINATQSYVMENLSANTSVVCEATAAYNENFTENDLELYFWLGEEQKPSLQDTEYSWVKDAYQRCVSLFGSPSCEVTINGNETLWLMVASSEESPANEVVVTCSVGEGMDGTEDDFDIPEAPELEDIEVPFGETSEPFDLLLQQIQTVIVGVPGDAVGSINCTAEADNGDVDLYVKVGAEPTITGLGGFDILSEDADCASVDPFSNESCEVQVDTPARIYASVFGYTTTTSITVSCGPAGADPSSALSRGNPDLP